MRLALLPFVIPSSARWRRWLRIVFAWCLIALGLAGLVLPLLQGVLFLVLGVVLLAREQAWAARLLDRLRRRHPRLAVLEARARVSGARIARRLGRRGK